MARKQTAGARFESDVPVKPIAKKPEELIAEEKAAAAAGAFPDNLKDGLVLLQTLSHEPVKDREEWESKQPRLRALRKHIHGLQQGLPTIATRAGEPGPSWADQLKRFQTAQLKQLAYTHPEVRALLDENTNLRKQIAELTQQQP